MKKAIRWNAETLNEFFFLNFMF